MPNRCPHVVSANPTPISREYDGFGEKKRAQKTRHGMHGTPLVVVRGDGAVPIGIVQRADLGARIRDAYQHMHERSRSEDINAWLLMKQVDDA